MHLNWIGVILVASVVPWLPSAAAEEDLPTTEIVASFSERPGNPSLTPEGRVLVSMQPLDNPTANIVEVLSSGAIRPYPPAGLVVGKNANIKAAIGIRTGDDGVAWILDMANKRFVGWDTRTEKQIADLEIPANVLKPHSFLQDFALDQKRHRAIVADMTQGDLKSAPEPAFIVVDLKTGTARRIAEKHPSMMPGKNGGFGLNPITIDPTYTWVYFGALNGKTVYRVPASSFDEDEAKVVNTIEAYGPKSYCDGITVDGAGNVYISDIEKSAIGVSTPGGYRLVATLPEGQSWPDGFSFGPDGYVYVTINQLNRSAALNNGEETGSGRYLLARFKPLASGSTGR